MYNPKEHFSKGPNIQKAIQTVVVLIAIQKLFRNESVIFLDRHQPGPIKSVLLVMIGWLVGWLVKQFSQKRLQGFF